MWLLLLVMGNFSFVYWLVFLATLRWYFLIYKSKAFANYSKKNTIKKNIVRCLKIWRFKQRTFITVDTN